MLPSPRRLLVLDDDPTGSQCVSGVAVAFEEDPRITAEALREEGSVCFVLTNTRALGPEEARAANRRVVAGHLAEAGRAGASRQGGGADGANGADDDAAGAVSAPHGAATGLHVVSRSDSTLRGHVIEEPNEIADVLAEHGRPVDAFLFCPAMIEAGRTTVDNVHYARVDGRDVPVEDTDFAQDATFGYSTSNLPAFLAEKGEAHRREHPDTPWRTPSAADVLTLSLEDIRTGGADRVAELLSAAHDRQWVVVNATEYADMEVVADAVTRLEAEGRTFVTRCGPSFVRALVGQSSSAPLTEAALTPEGGRAPHGLVVVGSHVGLTTKQLEAVQRRGTLAEVELNVPRLLDPQTREETIAGAVTTAAKALRTSDVVVYTSRDLVREESAAQSLDIARSVSDGVVEVVQRLRAERPAWVVAKGGITSHEVAHNGLGIRLARVEGQFFPGQISLFTPVEAPESVLGAPYVVFPGNVGGEEALADVVDRLSAAAAPQQGQPGERAAGGNGPATATDENRHGATPENRTTAMTAPSRPRVAWIGLGAMGSPMSLAVADAGLEVTAFDMSADALAAVAPRVSGAASAREAAEGADVVVIMVATGPQLQSVLFGSPAAEGRPALPGIADALTPETVVLVMATVGPEAIEAALTGLAGVTSRLVDAPVSGGVARAATGDLLVMVSGAETDVEAVRPLLDAMASNAPVVGPRPGDGQRFKIVNQLLCGVHIAAAGEALALASSMGLDVRQCYDVLGTGAAASFMFADRGARMVEESFDEVRSALDIFVKDMGLVTEAARAAGQEVPLAASAQEVYERGHREGLGRKDDSVVYELLRRR
ncbi:four-carbon acid sugar kinase family protein [Falsarthrobacter nasiphocae]|uniref:3-hydroxyisobutyrate dehydrogenase-like beta-hydroxyacid dehydrogenase/uncharacterized protein YgbK (DUF1537 family) n=1 Tax=Falsarthrobacter nasiphocae TaxID=189863 RepID=A0AAE3YEW5_9MICC|nr:four-carbon acid sugar kinase family protein [Falsarthrobacter nasiphocae]MDR6892124.1 3-hydroxyisobutyrate dehydrogenase-like beta-hydroxyacid dehydrogenase/uncharacterized protein YgbK (DUF1537 family) [Falsarthrobacter nasiphocae]